MHDSLYEDASVEDALEERRAAEMSARLVADPSRRIKTPGELLKIWQQHVPFLALRADLLAALEGAKPDTLSELAAKLCRTVLAAPAQAFSGSDAIIARLVGMPESLLATPEMMLAAMDIANALACAGADSPASLETRIGRWLPQLTDVGPPLSARIKVGAAAVAVGDLDTAALIAPPAAGENFAGGRSFPGDLLALIRYLQAASRAGASQITLDDAWHRVGEEMSELEGDGQLDEATLLWLGRAILGRFGGMPLGGIASAVHEQLWAIPGELDAATQSTFDFPISRTLMRKACGIESRLLGEGAQCLCAGRELATGSTLLVAVDRFHPSRQRIAELVSAVDYRSPGIFELVFVGQFDSLESEPTSVDVAHGHWAIVERMPQGEWLPRILRAADPWTAPRKAIELGRTAGRILADAANNGILLTEVRPELMWAERLDGHYAVTGLSTRATEMFRRGADDMVTSRVFSRFYYAPEAATEKDDRALAYSLAVMIAEWATGRYPFASYFPPHGLENASHEPIDAPPRLKDLLEATIRREPSERPSLGEFLAALDRLL